MFKRSLVIGGMIAGAFLLPNVASAGKVDGACVNCHTMHNSQGNTAMAGATTAGRPTLLKSDCAGCHASGTGTNDANGVDLANFGAPQIDDSTNILSGGYFNAISDATHHNVSNIDAADVDGVLGDVPPGGTDMGAMLSCEDCHQGTGGHHGTSGGFRLLSGVTGTPATNYGVNLAATAGVGNRSTASYTGTMNTFCASCHTNFHGAAQGAAGAWVRHPTDINISTSGTGLAAYSTGHASYATLGDVVPVGTGGTNDLVLCLSCHVPHGSANDDLLAFNYGGSGSYAGDGDAGTGCETCHSYTGTGM